MRGSQNSNHEDDDNESTNSCLSFSLRQKNKLRESDNSVSSVARLEESRNLTSNHTTGCVREILPLPISIANSRRCHSHTAVHRRSTSLGTVLDIMSQMSQSDNVNEQRRVATRSRCLSPGNASSRQRPRTLSPHQRGGTQKVKVPALDIPLKINAIVSEKTLRTSVQSKK